MSRISVFLADWQVLFREGIHFTLSGEEDLDVIGESKNNQEALDFIINNPPRIAILNVNHSELSGIDLTRKIRQDFPQVSVILVLDDEDEDRMYSALKCGASGCVTKDIDPDDLVRLIREIAGGAEPISHSLLKPGIAARVIEDFESFSLLDKEVDSLLANLTKREKDIIGRIGAGETIDNIGSALKLDEDYIMQCLDVVRGKIITNEHIRDVIEAAQKGLTSVIKRTRRGKSAEEYITKDEFESFKAKLQERFKSFIDG
jgi:DNA-binding NarL/FixJ family response regulator